MTHSGVLTTWVTFTPCFMWTFLGASYGVARRRRDRGRLPLQGRRHPLLLGFAVAGVLIYLAGGLPPQAG